MLATQWYCSTVRGVADGGMFFECLREYQCYSSLAIDGLLNTMLELRLQPTPARHPVHIPILETDCTSWLTVSPADPHLSPARESHSTNPVASQ